MKKINNNFKFLLITSLVVFLAIIFLFINNKKQPDSAVIVNEGTYNKCQAILDKATTSAPSSSEESRQYFKCRPIQVFLKNDASESEVQQFIKEVKFKDGVYKVNYISKENALEIYKTTHKDEPRLLESVNSVALPAAVEIYISDPVFNDTMKTFLSTKTFVEQVIAD